MKKLYNNPECKILLLQSEDVMSLSNGGTYDSAEIGRASAWDWGLNIG